MNWMDHTGSPRRPAAPSPALKGRGGHLGALQTPGPQCSSQATLAPSCLAVLVTQTRLGKGVNPGHRYQFPGEPWVRPAGVCAVPATPRTSDLGLAGELVVHRQAPRAPRAVGPGWRDGPAPLPRAAVFGGKPSS